MPNALSMVLAVVEHSNCRMPDKSVGVHQGRSIPTHAVIESFWGRMQTELLNRQRWKTRIELANAIFEYLEIFHNRRRRHSALGMRTPIEYEMMQASIQPVD